MKIYILVLFIIVSLTGCNVNQDINSNKEYQEALSQIEKITSERDDLETDFSNAEIKIKEMEKQIKDLKAELKEKDDLASKKVLKVIGAGEKTIKYVFDDKSIESQSISIIGCNVDGLVEDYEEIEINGLGNGEYFKAQVIGSIYDFQLIKLEWDNTANKLVEVEVIYKLDEVRNKIIYIETYLPCGIPYEKIKWKDSNGDIHEFVLGCDGYGFDGFIIWSK